MKTSKLMRFRNSLTRAALVCLLTALAPSARAANYIWNVPLGYWDDAANWIGGVPANTGDWDVSTINNNGTAILTNTAATFEETQVGNNGVAGNLVVTNGGVLTVNNWLVVGRTGDGGNTPLSRLIVAGDGVVNKTGDGFIVGDGTFCFGEVIVKDNGRVNITGGWNGIGNGNGGVGYLTLQDNAIYTLANQDWNIGDFGSGRGFAYIKDNAILNVQRFWIGKFDTSFGVVKQTGGAINGLSGGNEWCIGGQDGANVDSFGYYELSAGTFSTPNNFQIGRNGKGVIYQSGGTITASGWTALGRYTSGIGVAWVSGGTFAHTGNPQQFFIAENGRGEFTLSGAGVLDCNLKLRMGNPGGTGIANFNGGTARLPGIEQTGGSGYVNFNGTTIEAKISTGNFMSGMTEARIYAGNAIFDTSDEDITIAQQLVDGAGQGVISIAVTDGGAGYAAPPIVQIAGDGIGATALAQIDPVAGTVTNIIVTCPGYNYSAASVSVVGGGATTAATLADAVIGTVAGGGVVKNGAGTLTLTGPNTYTGPTIVNAGKLAVSSDSTVTSATTVANGASLGVTVLNPGTQLTQSGLTLGASALDFDLGSFGNPSTALMNVTGALTVNGTVTVNLATALPQLGQIPLVAYGSRAGSGSFVVGSLPSGVVANVVTNGNTIALNVTAVAAPRWDGQVSGVWDIGTTANWIELSTSLPASYADGNAVLFNDEALGTTNITLGVTVNPAKVTFNNTNLNYTVSGSGKISGATGLTKQGTGSLALNTQNDYTGVTRIEGGTVSVTNLANGGQPSGIGSASASANNLILAGGTLSYAGPAVAIDRGYSVQGPNSTINVQGDLNLTGPVTSGPGSGFVKTGPAKLTYSGAGVRELSGGGFPGYRVEGGTVVFDGTGGAQTNHSQNEFWVGNTINEPAFLILSNTTLNVDSWFSVGRGNGAAGYHSTATLYNSRLRSGNFSMGWDNGVAGHLASQTLILNGTSSISNNADMNLGESGGAASTILVNDSSIIFSDSRVHLGWHAGGVGTMTLANSSVMNVDAWFSIGHEGGEGTLTVKDNATLRVLWDMNVTDVNTGLGTMNIQGNAQVIWGSLFVGKGVGSVGVVNQTGGSVTATDFREAHVGFHGQGTYNLSAGSIVAPSHWFVVGRHADGPGEFNITGGTFTHGANDAGRLFRVGEDGTGVVNLSGSGSFVSSGNAVTLGNNASGNGTINLNGGSLQVRRILAGPGTGTFNFNGGVLRAGPNANADFFTGLSAANVQAGGAIIDTAGQNIAIAQALVDGGGNGGLTKQGEGALYLNGANTYVGPTLVNAGTLGGSGSVAGSVTLGAGATLAPGTSIGTFTVGNNLTLGSNTVMEVSKDGDAIASDLVSVTGNLAFGGSLTIVVTGTNVLAVNDTFNLFDWGTRSGSFTATNLPANYTWDLSQLAVDGTIKVTGVLLTPTVNPPVYSDGNLIMTGSGGMPGGSYTWLTATNVTTPMAQWTTNTTGTFSGSGAFSNALPVSTSEAARFFRLRVP